MHPSFKSAVVDIVAAALKHRLSVTDIPDGLIIIDISLVADSDLATENCCQVRVRAGADPRPLGY